MEKFEIDGKYYDIVIIRKKIKHTYLRLKNHTLTITANPYISKSQIFDLISKNALRISARDLETQKFFDSNKNKFMIFQKKYDIIKTKSTKNSYHLKDDFLYINYQTEDDIISLQKDVAKDATVHKALVYIEQHQKELQTYVNISGLMIKAQLMKSQFGSCHTTKKIIKLNSALAFFDEKYLHAILLHELVHLKIKGHQDNFYQLLEELCPNYREIRKELKKQFMNFEV